MPIPDFQACMLPLLRAAADGNEILLRDAVDRLALEFHLSREERDELLPSGRQAVFVNRVGWARTFLKKAGLLSAPRRGYFQITSRGRKTLGENPAQISVKYLERFPEYLEFKNASREKPENGGLALPESSSNQTPLEALEAAYEGLRAELAAEILSAVRVSDPSRFENIVVELLVKMGYGGSLKDAGRAIGRSGDEGIDGIIKEDHLGLDNIYIQAKRWEGTVSRPEIQKFAGALQGQRARKGIFITTSGFTKEARDFVSRIDSKIVLIDGAELATLMIDFGVGVTPVATYQLRKIDSDYFTET
ncbi:MAG: restriction endonuclease [Verrucomicrobiota bacterium]